MRQLKFTNGEYYHVFNRGTDKRTIFMNQRDYLRFYESMCLFNDANYKHPGGGARKNLLSRFQEAGLEEDSRQKFVDILSFSLLPNHFHFSLRQTSENGISTFMYKLGKGYASYFNKKYERSGGLFEGPFKAVHIQNDAQFYHLPRYIHLNVLDVFDKTWREGRTYRWKKIEQFINDYRWSSHHVYMKHGQLLPVVDDSFARENFSSVKKYLDYLKEWSGRQIPLPGSGIGKRDLMITL